MIVIQFKIFIRKNMIIYDLWLQLLLKGIWNILAVSNELGSCILVKGTWKFLVVSNEWGLCTLTFIIIDSKRIHGAHEFNYIFKMLELYVI